MDGKREAGRATEPPPRGMFEGVSEPTLASTWYAASGALITDRLSEWPPDVFALTNVVLTRAEAFCYALSVPDSAPRRFTDWAQAVEERAGAGPPGPRTVPAPCRPWWPQSGGCFAGAPRCRSRNWRSDEDRVCEALLTLHAMADEACAGLGVAVDSSGAEGCVYRAQGRELVARTGSLARVDARLLRVLPKVITPPTGRLVSALRLRARPRHRSPVAQDPGPPSRYRPSPRVRHPAATAVAAACTHPTFVRWARC